MIVAIPWWCQAAMAGNSPTIAELQALIITLQVQVTALQAAVAAAPAPPAPVPAVVFPDTPQMLAANDLINNSTKKGSAIFEHGFKALDDKALTDGFAMTPNQTIIFVEAFHHHTTAMGWNQGKSRSSHSPTALADPLI
jgi:hypothetical protein